MWRSRILTGVFVLTAAGFAAGLAHLFELRLSGGDIHPVYSSYRADALGTRLFHDALARLPHLKVERNMRSMDRLDSDLRTVVLMLGMNDRLLEFPVAERRIARLETMLAAGARVIVTFSRESRAWTDAPDDDDEEQRGDLRGDETEPDDEGAGAGPGDGGMEQDDGDERLVVPGERWGFAVDRLPFGSGEGSGSAPPVAVPTPSAPGDLPVAWLNSLRFTEVAGTWRTLYRRGEQPVIMERPFARGTLVLATDSFFVSNEGLIEEPQTELLAALIGERDRVVFDETVRGEFEQPGLVTLMRRYRLHGFAAGCLVLLALYLWRARTRPAPLDNDRTADQEDVMIGRESRAALVSLLRRSLSPAAALQACVAEWCAVFGSADPDLSRSLDRLKQDASNPVSRYRTMRNLIDKRKGRHVT